PDPEVLALIVKDAEPPGRPLALMFNHAGHPNVLSGDNYAISADYPGLAERLLENELGGLAMFVNGAQGSTDIDGLKDRDDAGLQRVGAALADAVGKCAADLQCAPLKVAGASMRYNIPARKITDAEFRWAREVMESTGGAVDAVADGVGDDYKARHYLKLREIQDRDIEVEQVALLVGDCAIVSFPGELFTEIGLRIKADSPFPHTMIAGLANGYIGYIPTAKALLEGGYEPDTRHLDASAEQIVLDKTMELLNNLNGGKQPRQPRPNHKA
ncbi:MAG: hypothetical protein LC725_10550, partial [Lentisphaerae bacterium]|nr:hypothetical protein [Lentisphaerota bacterium]